MTRFVAILLFSVIACRCIAQQTTPHEFQDFGIIDTSLNRLQIYGSRDKLDYLFAQLSMLAQRGEGRVNILHLGDSHIQADYFSGRMRKHFSTFITGGDASRGFIFPYAMAGTNNPANYHAKYTGEWSACRNIQKHRRCQLGLAGISATTRSPNARLTIAQNGGEHTVYGFNKVKIYHKIDSSSFGIRLLNDVNIISAEQHIEAGYTEIAFDKMQDTLRIEFSQFSPDQSFFELHGISLETTDDGITYSASGINGADVPAWLACPLLGAHIASLHPDMVIISLGTNDGYNSAFNATTFYANFDTLLTRIEKAAPRAILVLTTPGDNYRQRTQLNTNTEYTRSLLAKLAQAHRCVLWDFYTAMGGASSMVRWQDRGLSANDRVHLTKTGYLLQGDLLFSALMKEYDRYLDAYPIFEIPELPVRNGFNIKKIK